MPGNWFGSLPTLHWTAAELAVTQGSGQASADGLRVGAPGAQGIAIVSIQTSFRSAGYAAVAWDTADVPDNVAAALVWRNDYEPGRRFTRPLTVEARRLLPITLADDPNWIGRINGLALIVRGDLAQPMLIRGVEAKPMTAVQVLHDRVREWLAFEPWSGGSINSRNGGADAQDLPLPFVAGGHRRSRVDHLRRPGAVAAADDRSVPAADRRRPVRLRVVHPRCPVAMEPDAREAHATFQQYAGKSWRERHLAAEDGALFAFIEKARAKLPPPPVRVFMAADALYFRDRGAYHLYPYNVYFDPYRNTMPDAAKLRGGDYLVVFRRKGVQFDPAQKKLRWDGGQPVDAELLFAEGGGAVFAIH